MQLLFVIFFETISEIGASFQKHKNRMTDGMTDGQTDVRVEIVFQVQPKQPSYISAQVQILLY